MDLIERAAQKSKAAKKKASLIKKDEEDSSKPFKGIGGKSAGTKGAAAKGIGAKGIGGGRSKAKSKRPDPTAMGANKPVSKSASDEKKKETLPEDPKAKVRGIGGKAKRAKPVEEEIKKTKVRGLGGGRKKTANKSRNEDAPQVKSRGLGQAPKRTLADALERSGSGLKAIGADSKDHPNDSPLVAKKAASTTTPHDPILGEVHKNLAKIKKNIKPSAEASKKSQNYEELDVVALREEGFITPDMPPNLMAEEFRMIKRSILLNAFAGDEDKIKHGNVIMMTSSNPNEGKTYCSINLALSIATEQDTTVLLIDADFSKPEILSRIGLRGGKGIMDVVADPSLNIGDCLVRTNIPNLVILPAGRQHNRTTELLASERMAEIVDELSTRYPDRLVIFDAPPVLASSVPSVLSLHVGQIVFVIEAESTTEPQIKESLTMVSACQHINLLLNKTRVGSSNKKFATYYGYGGR